jgi:hypothetical protein
MKSLIALAALLTAALIVSSVALGAGRPGGSAFITDTLGGNGKPRAAAHVQGYRLITDTLGGNGGPSQIAAASPGATSFSWSAAGLGAAGTAGVVLALLGGVLIAGRRRMRVAV